jgi:dipeptidase D
VARLLLDAAASFDLRLAELVGGDTRNAIPRGATAVVAVPAQQLEAFSAYLADVGAALVAELAATDPDVALTATAVELPARVMAAEAQRALLGAVYGAPQGVLQAMSRDVPGLVQTSSNLGVLRIGGGRFAGGALVRSALDAERDAVARRTAETFAQAGADVSVTGAYGSWPPSPDSPLLTLMTQVYTDLFGVPPTIAAVHAGLEASVAGSKFPGMDMISVGPTIQNAHSPDERLEVAGVARVYDLLVATLGRIGASP